MNFSAEGQISAEKALMNKQKHCPTEPTHFADACASVPEAACLTIKTSQIAAWAAQSQP